jgi:hypothetical protein
MRRIAVSAVFLGVFAALVAVAAGPRESQWKKVNEAIQKGLPKTAIDELKPIIADALREGRHAEATRAIAQTIALEGQIEGSKAEEKVVRMRAEIAKAPAEMKPVLNTLLAHWFWQYYQQNRWRFLQRTQTASSPSDDFTTWDLPRILREIDQQFAQALADAPTLQKIPIAQYDDLLSKGALDDAHRPTLYDFLAHEALAFYTSGEQAANKPQDAFELAADSPALAPIDQFIDWKPAASPDDQSLTLRALQLYQQLLRFHQKDDDRTALLDADLLRLAYAKNTAVGDEAKTRYQAALRRFADQHANHPLSSLALAQLAQQIHAAGDWVEARKLALQGQQRFPASRGGIDCFNLVKQIEAPELQLATERVWAAPWPSIKVTYRNLTKVHFRVVSFDIDAHLKSNRYSPLQLDENQRRALLAQPTALRWSADLAATDDYQQKQVELPPQTDLKPGAYYLIASANEQFTDNNNPIQFCEFWLSNLSIVVRNRHGDGILEGFVLDSRTGDPLAGADVTLWQRRNNFRTPGPNLKTDANGLFRAENLSGVSITVDARANGQRLVSAHEQGVHQGSQVNRSYSRTFFFTDRALYRPGQTIEYKGIVFSADPENDRYKVLPNYKLTVALLDVNGKEVERREHGSNDYGSFSGSFTAPRDRLMGQMRIAVVGGGPEAQGQTMVSVEEYKRPKFQVSLDAPSDAAKLNGPVKLTGKAAAYTGAAIDGAKVKWRVVRQVRYPDWWFWRCWWMPPQPGQSQEIAHGTAVTGVDGKFNVEFTAKPDLSVDEDSEPRFHYAIHADVTDAAGETRSADRSITVGYTALAATLSADEWLVSDKAVEVRLRATTLDGEGQVAEGVARVYRLKSPEQVARPSLTGPIYGGPRGVRGRGAIAAPVNPPPADPSNPQSWPLGEQVLEKGLATDAQGNAKFPVELGEGMYRVKFETRDKFGKQVTAELPLRVVTPAAPKLGIKIPDLFAAPQWTIEPGAEFTALWGTGYETGRAFVEVEHRQKIVQAYWTEPGKTQTVIKQAVTEAMRGGFTVRVTRVRENRGYLHARQVDVPWTNKQLTIQWERFVSKLEPNQQEKWTAIVKGPDAKRAVAEMVAGLYDASLDAYRPHSWQSSFGVFRHDHSNLYSQFENSVQGFQYFLGHWQIEQKGFNATYRSFPPDLIGALTIYGNPRMYMRRGRAFSMEAAGAAPPAPAAAAADMDAFGANRAIDGLAAEQRGEMLRKGVALGENAKQAADKGGGEGGAAGDGGPGGSSGPDLNAVSARKNLRETAFFFPKLVANSDGEVKIEFTMPEALTEWKFLGFAHDRELRSGLLVDKVVTSKDLMVQPNAPRFVREGDQIEFTVKVSNQSAARQVGKVRLTLADARTAQSVDASFQNSSPEQEFDIPAQESRTLSWKIKTPDDAPFLIYKAVGSSGRVSDGEEGYLPVLSRRILVTESLPLPIRGPGTKEFQFQRLIDSGKSDTLKHKTYSIQMVSNPSWYAVMALPYLMEYPHECAEQTFNRLYANALARHIAQSDPKIRRVFEQWKGTPALDSPLTKNQDLKAVALEETPWVRQAERESQARRDVGILFDENRLNDETARTMAKLADMQLGDGAWPWFPGGRENDYITLYITTGFGRMRHLGVKLDMAPAIRALDRLDGWADRMYRDILARKVNKNDNHLSTTIALYLYCRSFYLEDKPIAADKKEAVDYWLGQARKYWLRLNERQSQGHLALGLKRFGDRESAIGIVNSLRERSVSNEEMGMFWRDTELSWWWYRAPIETQAVMIEAFDEVAGDAKAVEDCKVWLLKQKQTQDWKTTKATADAVYALLLRGANQLASDALVEVTVGGERVKPESVEAGTGFFEERRLGGEIKPELGRVSLKKVDAGVAWGSVHWQYLEDMTKVTAYDGTPLKLRKTLYTKRASKKGPELAPVTGEVNVGDELVVRVELRVDRDMEYVHLKDQRGSGTEPVNVLSGYRYQDGLAYYESTRDTASHFFIDYLPKGVYVFEYSTRVQLKGRYQTGIASIECMYAPEFNSHSESFWLEAK